MISFITGAILAHKESCVSDSIALFAMTCIVSIVEFICTYNIIMEALK